QIAVTGLGFSVTQEDGARGEGKPQFGPICISKHVDSATVQLMEAMATNEVLTSVSIALYRPSTARIGTVGTEENFVTYKLTNAFVRSNKVAGGATATTAGQAVEQLSFVYDSIEVDTPPSKKTFSWDLVKNR